MGSDIKSSESNNFNNIIIKVIRIRHKLVKQGMTVKQVGKTKKQEEYTGINRDPNHYRIITILHHY